MGHLINILVAILAIAVAISLLIAGQFALAAVMAIALVLWWTGALGHGGFWKT